MKDWSGMGLSKRNRLGLAVKRLGGVAWKSPGSKRSDSGRELAGRPAAAGAAAADGLVENAPGLTLGTQASMEGSPGDGAIVASRPGGTADCSDQQTGSPAREVTPLSAVAGPTSAGIDAEGRPSLELDGALLRVSGCPKGGSPWTATQGMHADRATPGRPTPSTARPATKP